MAKRIAGAVLVAAVALGILLSGAAPVRGPGASAPSLSISR
jgi:hypothetical protein